MSDAPAYVFMVAGVALIAWGCFLRLLALRMGERRELRRAERAVVRWIHDELEHRQ